MHRTSAEVGAILRQRREALNKTQDQLVYVSAATVRKLEGGTEPRPRLQTQLRLARALRWPPDAYEQLIQGADPRELAHVPDPLYDDAPPTGDVASEPTNAELGQKLDHLIGMVEKLGGKQERRRGVGAGADRTPSSMPRPALRGRGSE